MQSIINFKNIDDNIIFNLLNHINEDVPKLIIEILNKSNLLELRDVNNNNIILLFIKKFNIDNDIIYNLLKTLNNNDIIYEKNNENISIYDLIKNNKIIQKLNVNYKEKNLIFLK